MVNYKIQSVLFSTKKWNPETATKWLIDNDFKVKKIDMKTSNFLRFRQVNPEPLEKQGFKFINKKLDDSGIELVIAYPTKLKGGKVSVAHLKRFIDNSYSTNPDKNIDDYVLDESLSNDIAKVYHNPKTGHATITHRGTSGLKDWANNVAYATGLYKYTDRYKRGKKAQEDTEKKYGAKNVSTIGHSQGSVLSRNLGENSKEIINLNPAYIAEKPKSNEYNIKSSRDVVSGLKKTHTNDINVQAETYNPLTEHSTEILNRLNPDQLIGQGMKPKTKLLIGGDEVETEKMKLYQIRDLIKKYNAIAKDEDKIRGYSNKTRTDLINLLIDKYKINSYDVIMKNPKPTKIYERIPADPRSKYGKKKYTDEQQAHYLEELEENKKYKNPLKPLAPYINKEGKEELITLEPHQKDFIKEFIFSNLRGAVVFHGVGSGKTLTAVVSSYYYLKMFPTKKVIVISPSALLYNFTNGMIQYGLNISDNRYSFYTYDKYIREVQKENGKDKMGDDALVIIDEAHNFRTEIFKANDYDRKTGEKIGEKATTNIRGDKIMAYATERAHKVLLLTGTAFVNSIYDVENLLAMIEAREPISSQTFAHMLGSGVDMMQDYFNYKISLFKTSPTSIYFPKKYNHLIPLVMDTDLEGNDLKDKDGKPSNKQEAEYDRLKEEGREGIESEKPNTFYSAERYASNYNLGGIQNNKVQWIMRELKAKPNEKFIIYSGLYDSGIKGLQDALRKEKIGFASITGAESTTKKEYAKKLFNGYNFNNENFFTEEQKKQPTLIINDKTRVLLITKAGAEGVDTINTNNIVLVDQTWNDALAEQIIARAVRYKSHFQLEDTKRYVNVYRLFLIRKSNIPVFKEIQKAEESGNTDKWIGFGKSISDAKKLSITLHQKDEGKYEPTVEELRALKRPITEQQKKSMEDERFKNLYKPTTYIPEVTKYKKVSHGMHRKSTMEIDGSQGWDKFNEIERGIKSSLTNTINNLKNQIDKSRKQINEEIKKAETNAIEEIKRKQRSWKIDRLAEWYANIREKTEDEKKDYKGFSNSFSDLTSDLNMFILSKSKTANIERFVEDIGKNAGQIQVFEKYMKMNLIEEIMKIDTQLNQSSKIIKLRKRIEETDNENERNKLNEKLNEKIDEKQASLYAEILKQSTSKILNTSYKPDLSKSRKAREVELQQYYTDMALAHEIVNNSTIKENKQEIIRVLEPTAGDGALIRPLLKLDKPLNIDLVEYDPVNRKKLINLTKGIHQLNVQNEINFLRYFKGAIYDYIFTNPPFDLKVGTDASLERTVWDVDFIKRAFAMLKVNGQMMAIAGTNWIFSKDNEENRIWLTGSSEKAPNEGTHEDDIATIKWKIEERIFKDVEKSKEGEKVISKKVTITIFNIIKKSTILDNKILNEVFYKNSKKEIQDGIEMIMNIKPIPEVHLSKSVKAEIKKEEKEEAKNPPLPETPNEPNEIKEVDLWNLPKKKKKSLIVGNGHPLLKLINELKEHVPHLPKPISTKLKKIIDESELTGGSFFGNIANAFKTTWNKPVQSKQEGDALKFFYNDFLPTASKPIQIIAPPVGTASNVLFNKLREHQGV